MDGGERFRKQPPYTSKYTESAEKRHRQIEQNGSGGGVGLPGKSTARTLFFRDSEEVHRPEFVEQQMRQVSARNRQRKRKTRLKRRSRKHQKRPLPRQNRRRNRVERPAMSEK